MENSNILKPSLTRQDFIAPEFHGAAFGFLGCGGWEAGCMKAEI